MIRFTGTSGTGMSFRKRNDYTQDANCLFAYTWDEVGDTASTLIDASGNARNGSYENGASVGTGKWGSGGLFENDGDADDYIDITFGDYTLSDFTLVLWFKTADTDGSTSQYPFMWAETAGAGDRFFFLLNDIDANTLYPYFRHEGGAQDNLTPSVNVADQAWHHIACVIDGSNQYLYLDGTLYSDTCTNGLTIDDTELTYIGNNSTTDREVDGVVDEIGFFTRALTADEIEEIMDNGLRGTN